jgi:hypothetical protein
MADYCRVPCEYKHRNLSVRVEERSHAAAPAPGDLAIRFLYQGGQTDIVAVDVAQVRYGCTHERSRPVDQFDDTYVSPKETSGLNE